jgi:hypothetical protein
MQHRSANPTFLLTLHEGLNHSIPIGFVGGLLQIAVSRTSRPDRSPALEPFSAGTLTIQR